MYIIHLDTNALRGHDYKGQFILYVPGGTEEEESRPLWLDVSL